MQVLIAQNTLFEAFYTFLPPKSQRKKCALRKACKIEIRTHAFGYFDALLEQKIDPL